MSDLPASIEELFENGACSYSFVDYNTERDNVAAMEYFLDKTNVSYKEVAEDLGTQVTLVYNNRSLVINSYGLGDFYSHGFDVEEVEYTPPLVRPAQTLDLL